MVFAFHLTSFYSQLGIATQQTYPMNYVGKGREFVFLRRVFKNFNLNTEIVTYRNSAIIGRSKLVADTLSFQAKTNILCHFYLVILRLKT